MGGGRNVGGIDTGSCGSVGGISILNFGGDSHFVTRSSIFSVNTSNDESYEGSSAILL